MTCDSSECLDAEIGYYVDGSGDSKSCETEVDSNCASCSSNAGCDYCKGGYLWDGSNCVECGDWTNGIRHCTECVDAYDGTDICLTCEVGYAKNDDWSACFDCS